MTAVTLDWRNDLERWLKPFLDLLGDKRRRRMCPVYVSGLIGPGDRKSIQPMAERVAPSGYDQLHHFVSAGVWDPAAVETELLVQADKLVGAATLCWSLTTRPYSRKAGIPSVSRRNI